MKGKTMNRFSSFLVALVFLTSLLLSACGLIVSSSTSNNKIVVAVDGVKLPQGKYTVQFKQGTATAEKTAEIDKSGELHLSYTGGVGDIVFQANTYLNIQAFDQTGKKVWGKDFYIDD